MDTYSETFLKDMLKDPRFSLDRQHNYVEFMKTRTSVMDIEVAQPMASCQRVNHLTEKLGTREQRVQGATDKENATSRIFHGYAGAASRNEVEGANALGAKSRLFPTPQLPASPATSKAISSMAANTYHAQGILPSYDGAGKAQAASLYQHQSHRASHNRPRVHLPLPSAQSHSYDSSDQPKRSAAHDRSSHGTNSRYMPVMFGYDGSEEPAGDDDKGGTKTDRPGEKRDESTDHKEVTNADFDNHRPDHDNEWHRGTVNDFFRDLHEKEVKWMMARQRKNTKTAP